MRNYNEFFSKTLPAMPADQFKSPTDDKDDCITILEAARKQGKDQEARNMDIKVSLLSICNKIGKKSRKMAARNKIALDIQLDWKSE